VKRTLKSLAFIVVASTVILGFSGGLASILGLDGGPATITIGKETTYITEPLKPDGTVDYIAAVNARLKEIKPEDNAAVLLVKAFGPKVALKEVAAEYFRLLGCDPPPEKGDYLVEINEIMKQRKIDDKDLLEKYDKLQIIPWKERDYPLMAEALRINEAPLKLIVEATRKKHFAVPYVTGKAPPFLIHCQMGMTQESRTCARLLCLRAMKRFEEGKIDDALADLEACHRLANLVGSPPTTLMECLVANALRLAALRGENTIALSGRLSPEALRKRAAYILALPPPMDVVKSIGVSERMMSLDSMSGILLHGYDSVFGQPKGTATPTTFRLSPSVVAYDEAMRTVNGIYDELLEAFGIDDPKKRRATLDALHSDIHARGRRSFERQRTFFLFREKQAPHPRGEKAAAGQRLGEVTMGYLTPALSMADISHLRTLANQRLTGLAYMLAAYRKERGTYPDKLDAKELGVPADALVDPFLGEPFVWRIEKGKRQIVCADMDGIVGPNKKKGSAEKPVDDIVLELP
jgi:hypothetical protein